jgi:hypothetical protein
MRSILDLTSDLEADLKNDPNIVAKAKESYAYAQNLYAALCNNEFQRNHFWLILSGEKWSCSWRYAGGLVSEIRDDGEDYMDFYCSGIGFYDKEGDADAGFVPESMVTEEIRNDLKSIGWNILEEGK